MNNSNSDHEPYIRRAISVAQRARDEGNHPFGAILVGPDKEVLLEAGNAVVTERDCTLQGPGDCGPIYPGGGDRSDDDRWVGRVRGARLRRSRVVTRPYCDASLTSVDASTLTPAVICSGLEYSSGRWLTPARHGMKIIPTGQTCAMNNVSW